MDWNVTRIEARFGESPIVVKRVTDDSWEWSHYDSDLSRSKPTMEEAKADAVASVLRWAQERAATREREAKEARDAAAELARVVEGGKRR